MLWYKFDKQHCFVMIKLMVSDLLRLLRIKGCGGPISNHPYNLPRLIVYQLQLQLGSRVTYHLTVVTHSLKEVQLFFKDRVLNNQ